MKENIETTCVGCGMKCYSDEDPRLIDDNRVPIAFLAYGDIAICQKCNEVFNIKDAPYDDDEDEHICHTYKGEKK